MSTAAQDAQHVALHEAKVLSDLTGSKVYVWEVEPMRYLKTLTPDRDWPAFAVVLPPRKVVHG